MSSLRPYVVQAQRGGTEGVYELASQDGLTPTQLGTLAQHLRELDPKWKLDASARRDLIDRLLEAGVSVSTICDFAGCDRTTVWRRRRNFPDRAEGAEDGPAIPLSMRGECCKTAVPVLRAAVLHFDATSGGTW
jgi:hypothetical protein